MCSEKKSKPKVPAPQDFSTTHQKKAEYLKQEGPGTCNMSCGMICYWWTNSELQLSVFTSCHSVSSREVESPIPRQNGGGDEKLSTDSVPGKRERQEVDGLGAAPYRPPILSYPGRITRHSAKLKLAVNHAFICLWVYFICLWVYMNMWRSSGHHSKACFYKILHTHWRETDLETRFLSPCFKKIPRKGLTDSA